MTNPTSNFGWQMPTASDLVTDLPADFETFGQAVDTSLADLKGGTTGQILSKASGTDMDFTWTTPNPGDITGVTAGTGITGGGTSGDVTVSFDVANYGGGQFAAGKNKIINGDFYINQRQFTSTTTNGAYGFDRWALQAVDGTTTWSAETFTPGTAPVAGYEGTNFSRLVSTGQTLTTAQSRILQKIEDVRTFAGQTVTVSFWAKASTGTPNVAVNLSQNFGSGGSSSIVVAGSKIAISASWARYSATFSVPSVSGKTIGTSSHLFANLWISAGSDRNTDTNSLGIQSVTVDFWGVQIEAGSVATAFQTATGNIQGELAACQRYYWRQTADASSVYGLLGNGPSTGTTTVASAFQNPVSMRTAASSVDFSTLQVNDGVTLTSVISVTLVASRSTSRISSTDCGTGGGLTVARFYAIGVNNSSTGYIGFSAEL